MKTVKITKSEWEKIGKKTGWMKEPIHPLDRKCQSSFGEIPEENYYRAVWSKLVDIVADTEKVSEKSFGPREAIHKQVDSLLRNANVMKVIAICETSNKRPEYCAELLFDKNATAVLSKASSTKD